MAKKNTRKRHTPKARIVRLEKKLEPVDVACNLDVVRHEVSMRHGIQPIFPEEFRNRLLEDKMDAHAGSASRRSLR